MLIPIMYADGKHDMIKDFLLTSLIDNRGIAKFKRGNNWVSISSPEIRRTENTSYTGPERRQQP